MKKTHLFFILFLYFILSSTTGFCSNLNNNNINDSQAQLEEYYKNGISLYKNKNYASAIPYLLKVEEYYKNNKNVYIALGESYRQLNNYQLSIKYFIKAYDLGSKEYITLTGLGYSYMDTRNYSNAYNYLVEAMNLFPSNPDPAWNTGITCDQLGKTNCTLNAMKKVIEIEPSYGVEPYLYVGFIYSNNKKYNYSLQYYLKGLDYFPQNSLLYYYAGDIYYSSSEYQSAIKYLEQAVKYDTKFLDAYYLLGMGYIQINNLDYAMDECNNMKNINSTATTTKDLCNTVSQKQMEQQMQQQMIQDQIQQDIQTQQDIQNQQLSSINM